MSVGEAMIFGDEVDGDSDGIGLRLAIAVGKGVLIDNNEGCNEGADVSSRNAIGCISEGWLKGIVNGKMVGLNDRVDKMWTTMERV